MKTKPIYSGNLLTSQLRVLPNGTIFSEHVFDGLAPEPVLYKKIETTRDDIVVEPLTFGQYHEVPGERHCLGFTDASDREWRVWSRENVEKMIGWLMTSRQSLE
jgi:hypothetical protein